MKANWRRRYANCEQKQILMANSQENETLIGTGVSNWLEYDGGTTYRCLSMCLPLRVAERSKQAR